MSDLLAYISISMMTTFNKQENSSKTFLTVFYLGQFNCFSLNTVKRGYFGPPWGYFGPQ